MRNRCKKTAFKIGLKNGLQRARKWEILSECRDFLLLVQNMDLELLDLFEIQIEEYLNMYELTEHYLEKVPMSVCWYEGLIDTEMLLMEMKDYVLL
ncbi:hypothetical protein [Lacrimispora xylanisolvens]|uniref:hypothetical protein n=1 Tax=Lacrimispora xylanisolvens TaxID=384636 RepID=UPI002402D325